MRNWKLETANLNLVVLLTIGLLFMLGGSASAASTNLSYTAANINQALTIAPENSNSVANIETNAADISATKLMITNTAFSAGLADIGFAETTISTNFNQSSYTEIDLSSYVGTNYAICMLRVENLANAGNGVSFRTPGDPVLGDYDGISSTQVDNYDGAYLIVPTSSSGVIECKTGYGIEIYLKAFIRRREF